MPVKIRTAILSAGRNRELRAVQESQALLGNLQTARRGAAAQQEVRQKEVPVVKKQQNDYQQSLSVPETADLMYDVMYTAQHML